MKNPKRPRRAVPPKREDQVIATDAPIVATLRDWDRHIAELNEYLTVFAFDESFDDSNDWFE